MASALIHLAVAKKVNEVLKMDEKDFLVGAIAPDIAKFVGSSRKISHFISKVDSDIPEIDLFLSKYKSYLKNPFELGYFVHLVTDVLWFKEFLPNFVIGDMIFTKSGEKLKLPEDEILEMLYNDYTSMNSEVLDYYGMDLSLFYQEFPLPESHIKELPSEYLPDLISKMGAISKNVSNYSYVLDIKSIVHFIEFATVYCLDEIKRIEL